MAATEPSSDGLDAGVSALSVGEEDGSVRRGDLSQATFFRAVESSNLSVVSRLLRDGDVDINGLNDEGVSALILAVYQYERRRSTDVLALLLESGADPVRPTPTSAVDRRICIVQKQHYKGGSPRSAGPTVAGASDTVAVGLGKDSSSLVSEQHSTRKTPIGGKTPLLLALELKSALYVKGWEYRHWDAFLTVLAEGTSKALQKAELLPGADAAEYEATVSGGLSSVSSGWAAVFRSGKHETLELRAEGKHLEVLKLLLITSSKVLRRLVEAAELQGHKGRLELTDASFTVIKELVSYLYSGRLDEAFVRTRGVDLLLAAHKYRIHALQEACVEAIEANSGDGLHNWIRLITVALQVGSSSLMKKCADSISATLAGRQVWRGESEKVSFASTFVPPAGGVELGAAEASDSSTH